MRNKHFFVVAVAVSLLAAGCADNNGNTPVDGPVEDPSTSVEDPSTSVEETPADSLGTVLTSTDTNNGVGVGAGDTSETTSTTNPDLDAATPIHAGDTGEGDGKAEGGDPDGTPDESAATTPAATPAPATTPTPTPAPAPAGGVLGDPSDAATYANYVPSMWPARAGEMPPEDYLVRSPPETEAVTAFSDWCYFEVAAATSDFRAGYSCRVALDHMAVPLAYYGADVGCLDSQYRLWMAEELAEPVAQSPRAAGWWHCPIVFNPAPDADLTWTERCMTAFRHVPWPEGDPYPTLESGDLYHTLESSCQAWADSAATIIPEMQAWEASHGLYPSADCLLIADLATKYHNVLRDLGLGEWVQDRDRGASC